MRPSLLGCSLVVVTGLTACKDIDAPGERAGDGYGDSDVVEAGHARSAAEFYAADAAYLQKNSNFFYKVFNQAFVRRLAELPSVGEVPDERKPHSGGYYAENDGGTNQIVAGNKTPLQKYDQAFHNGETLAETWEKQKHTTGPAWAGHCNGFAATAQRHPQEPFKNVVRGGITFTPQDIKALLAEVHMNADYEFLGGNRCELPGNPGGPAGRNDPAVMGTCEDINPGTMHAALGNWLGRMKHTLVMDSYAGDEVWNYPLFKYQVLQNDAITKAQAKQYVAGTTGGEYVFNPGAVKFHYLRTRLTYAEASRTETIGKYLNKSMDLTYVLELDADGNILGGEWVGTDSQRYHPDFLWVALELLEPNGTRYMGNPHLSNEEVIKLWAESIDADPENPPQDIVRPSGVDNWGKWAQFSVVLDGNVRGAVFGGKETVLRIKREGALASGDIDLEVQLNGEAFKTFGAAGGEDFTAAFDAPVGLNRFRFTFTNKGSVVEDQFLRFHVVR